MSEEKRKNACRIYIDAKLKDLKFFTAYRSNEAFNSAYDSLFGALQYMHYAGDITEGELKERQEALYSIREKYNNHY